MSRAMRYFPPLRAMPDRPTVMPTIALELPDGLGVRDFRTAYESLVYDEFEPPSWVHVDPPSADHAPESDESRSAAACRKTQFPPQQHPVPIMPRLRAYGLGR